MFSGETNNTASSSRSKIEQIFITKSQAYKHGKFIGFLAGSIVTSLFSLALDFILTLLNVL